MATRSLYTLYKWNTDHLLEWMVLASTAILEDLGEDKDEALPTRSIGRITLPELLAMSNLIGAYHPSVPSVAYRLLKSTIDIHTQAHDVFQQVASQNPDRKLRRDIKSHQRFIDVLVETFDALGGKKWESVEGPSNKVATRKDLEELVLVKKLSGLSLDEPDDAQDSENGEAADAETKAPSAPVRRRAIRPGRGRKHRNKNKKRKRTAQSVNDPPEAEEEARLVYRLVEDPKQHEEDGPGLATDYLLAVYDLFRGIAIGRMEIQAVWKEAAYQELNTAAAGAVSNAVIRTIQNIDEHNSNDFPGDYSYHAVFDMITQGNPGKIGLNFALGTYGTGLDQDSAKAAEPVVDIEEQFLFYTYRDLRDFILDFQLSRTGKPSYGLIAQLQNWKQQFDLRRASKQERIQWRRAYTINWLYDLVNVFSSVVVQRNHSKKENHDLARVDWSVSGPWASNRRLFGLNEFAGFVTSLAMQEPGFDIASKILPHHVFQLQCIVDSMTVSRGWFISGRRGHIILRPPSGFIPRRDVDRFLDRTEKENIGFLQGASLLKTFLDCAGLRHIHERLIIGFFQSEFRDWLAESKYKDGLDPLPPSRFSSSNSNGLWQYSPFLCGVGLLEALEISYLVGIHLFETIPEPGLVLHLHNLVLKKGYLESPIKLWGGLELVFSNAFFLPQGPPDSDFIGAYLQCLKRHNDWAEKRWERFRKVKSTAQYYTFLADIQPNARFRRKPLSLLLRETDWDLEALPESELPLESMLAAQVFSLTKEVVDPKTKETKWEDTELMRRAKVVGMSDEFLRGAIHSLSSFESSSADMVHNMLEWLKQDILTELAGGYPMLGLSYLWIVTQAFAMAQAIVKHLDEAGNPFFQDVFGPHSQIPHNHRPGTLFADILASQDPDCLRAVAYVFCRRRMTLSNNMYWRKLEFLEEREAKYKGRVEPGPDCVLM